jgi:hypothetical protein
MRRPSWKRTLWVVGVLLGLEAIGFLGLAVSNQMSWFIYMFAVMVPFTVLLSDSLGICRNDAESSRDLCY